MATFDYLVVGGGGGGGYGSNELRGGGGGGAGCVKIGALIAAVGSYNVIIGGGGAGATALNLRASNGFDSTLAGNTSLGGGGGSSGGNSGNSGGGPGLDGACGGGAGDSGGQLVFGGAGTHGGCGGKTPQSGGNGASGAGGGGANGDGSNGVSFSTSLTAGGPGKASSITGAALTYGVGGSGGGVSPSVTGAPGAANTGNGGNGGSSNAVGGAGGSGVVVVAYSTTLGITATGGTITSAGGKTIHTFTTAGTFTITAIGTTPVIDYMAVGGGGGGGRGSTSGRAGGGGGAGGVVVGSVAGVVGTFPVVIGAGGAPAPTTSSASSKGADTTITGGATVTAYGGGGGGSGDGNGPGTFGGSGGGAGDNGGSPSAGGQSLQGFLGGQNASNTGAGSSGGSGGGGGGFNSAGGRAAPGGAPRTNGGAGYSADITGTTSVYAQGGSGGANNGGVSGANGAWYGYGGGGADGGNSGLNTGGTGGQGIVVFSYPTTSGITATGGTITTSGGKTIHTFATVGSFTFTVVSVGLQTQSIIQFSTQANLARGGISFASNSAVQLLAAADLTPGFRPPAFLLPSGYETLEDNSGASVPGGLVWTYQAGTTTPLPTYTDSTLTVVNSNPIICDGGGRWTAWVPIGTAYKLVFEGPAVPPAHGPLIKTVDGIQVLSLPLWTGQPYNVANFTAIGGGTWTVNPGDMIAYQWLLDGKRLFLSLGITNTSIAGTVAGMKVALPAGIVSAPWTQVGPALIFENSNSIGTLGYWQVDSSTNAIYFGRADRAYLAVSADQTWVWFNGMIAIT